MSEQKEGIAERFDRMVTSKELAAILGKPSAFIKAMKRAGYQFELPPLDRTTFEHANAWLSEKGWLLDPVKYERPIKHEEPKPKSKRKGISASLRHFIFNRDGYTCHYCGVREDLTVDHKLCVDNGGTNDPENLVACCFSCNLRKGIMPYEEFRVIAHLREPVLGGRPGKKNPQYIPTREDMEKLLETLNGTSLL